MPDSTGSQTAGLRDLITECGAVLHGHFKLASGRHSDTYIEKFRILEQPDVLEEMCRPIADHFRDKSPDLIAGPSTGGILVAYEVARQLGKRAVYVESEGNRRVLKRNTVVPPKARVLLVDDVLTTGISLKEVTEVIAHEGAELVGIGVLIDRSDVNLDLPLEPFASCRFQAVSYAEDEMPEALRNTPMTTPGTRAAHGS